jgi:sugar phosphate isomerase/epimerase
MRLGHDWHLAYCTNIHRGETWAETFANLERHTLAVRARVSPEGPYAIGLRLGADAARELARPRVLAEFRDWLDRHDCYVFTINGFPYGQFHGTRVKEQVYVPDWTTPERLAYTKLLFELLAQLLPPGVAGSVSTVPGSFKEFIRTPEQERAMRVHLWQCVEFLAALGERTGRELHLGLEPEPLCYLETTEETVRFFGALRDDRPVDARLDRHLGVNYDACHLAVEFEEPAVALGRLRDHGIRLSKVHLSNALSLPAPAAVGGALHGFQDAVYLHQVVVRDGTGRLRRFRDLDAALAAATGHPPEEEEEEEWRVHFHVPLHCQPAAPFQTTAGHLQGVLDVLGASPHLCQHFEMETYTWDVLPPALKTRDVEDQLVAEYDWTLAQLAARGIRPLVPR